MHVYVYMYACQITFVCICMCIYMYIDTCMYTCTLYARQITFESSLCAYTYVLTHVSVCERERVSVRE